MAVGEDKKPQFTSQLQPDRQKEAEPVKGIAAPEKPAAQAQFTQKTSSGNAIGAYADPCQPKIDLSAAAWNQEKESFKDRPWNATPEGRFAIRAFSRGILGCAFFAAGNRIATVGMRGYHPERAPTNPVQGIAKFFDIVAGKPIRFAVNMLGGDGQRAVTFRPTRVYYGALGEGGQLGRSLGHEIVGVTFDFATMSVGDAMGRDIAGVFDPNVTKSWMKDGKIDYPQGIRSLAMSAFRYLTYNQGEDWAVALPYVYFIRAQRNLINKFNPGFAYDSDRGLNGGSFKVDDHGRITGNYQLAGLLDLQTRFSVYNVGTLMFREAYMKAADSILTWKEHGYNALKEKNEPGEHKSFGQSVADSAKTLAMWAARDTVKGFIYMTPSVPFFWISRTPQSKASGLLINPEKGALMYNTGGKSELVHVNELNRSTNMHRPLEQRFTGTTPVHYSAFDHAARQWHVDGAAPNPLAGGRINPYGQTFGITDAVLNQAGKANNALRKSFHAPVHWAENTTGLELDRQLGAKRFMDAYAKAALAYTPYFWAKTEFARKWDNGRMDTSIERMLKGAVKLNFSEFKAGLGEIADSLNQRPLSDPAREAEAQERIQHDISPADVFDPEVGKLGHRGCSPKYREKLLAKKEKAVNRLEQMKARNAMTFSEQVMADRNLQKTPSVLEEPKSEGYVAQENTRQMREEFAPMGTTIH